MENPARVIALALALTPMASVAKVTFDDDVLPIFEQACLNCHNPDKAKGGLDLSSYTAALRGGSGGKVVETDVPGSKLLAVVRQTSEPVMPPEGDPLDADRIRVLEEWIAGGLLENRSSSAKKPSKPKFDTTLSGDASTRPDGPLPMPRHVLLDPVKVTERTSPVRAIAASPWSPLLAVTGQRQILLFHTGSLELAGVLPFPEGDPLSLAFTPDARYLIVGGGVPGRSGLTVTYDVRDGSRMLTAGREFDSILTADLHPKLGTVATGSPSRLVKVWNTGDGSQLASIKKHTDWVTALDYSPDGVLLATGDRNGGIWVWEAEATREFHTLRGHQAGISTLSFRRDSNLLASASGDGSVRIWDMNQGTEIRKLDAHSGGATALAWSHEGLLASAGRDRKACVWTGDFKQALEIKDLGETPTSVAFSPDGKRLFVGGFDGLVSVFDAKSGKRLGSLTSNPPSIATRLARLLGKRNQAKAKLAEDIEALKIAKLGLEDSRKRLEDAEAADRLSAADVKKAEDALARCRESSPPDPASEVIAADALELARQRNSKTADELGRIRDEVKASSSRIDERKGTVEGTRAEIAELRKQESHWKAADLNALALRGDTLATELDARADTSARTFRETVAGIEKIREALAQKRSRRSTALAALDGSDRRTTTELRAVIDVLDAVIADLEHDLAQAAKSLRSQKAEAGSDLSKAAGTRIEAAVHRAAYFSELAPSP